MGCLPLSRLDSQATNTARFLLFTKLPKWLPQSSWRVALPGAPPLITVCFLMPMSFQKPHVSWTLMKSHETVFQVFSQYPNFGSETSSLWFLADPSIIQVQLCQILGQGIATFTAFQLCELPHLFTSCGRTVASGTAGDQAIWYHKNWTVSSWSEISGWKTHCPCMERLTCRTTNWHGTSTGRNHEVWWEDRSWCLRVYLQSSFWSLISILIDTHDQFGEALLTPKSGWIAYTSGFSIFSTIW